MQLLSFFPFFFFIVSQSAEVLGEAGNRRVPHFHGHTEYHHLDRVITSKNYM